MVSLLVVGRNTFVSRAYAQTYLADSPRGTAWDGADDEAQDRFLITATRLIQRQPWDGERSMLLTVGSVAIVAGGTGYTLNDLLTVAGGTTDSAAVIKVTAVSSGVVTSAVIVDRGIYTTLPTSPAAVTGGTGTGATFNLTSAVQVLAFPRIGLECHGEDVSSTEVPEEVKEATCELAFEMFADAGIESSSGTGSNISEVHAGPVGVSYFRPTDGIRNQRFPTIVFELLRCFMGGNTVVGGMFGSGTDVESSFDDADEYGLNAGMP